MKSIKELEADHHDTIGVNDMGYGYLKALKDVVKLIKEMHKRFEFIEVEKLIKKIEGK